MTIVFGSLRTLDPAAKDRFDDAPLLDTAPALCSEVPEPFDDVVVTQILTPFGGSRFVAVTHEKGVTREVSRPFSVPGTFQGYRFLDADGDGDSDLVLRTSMGYFYAPNILAEAAKNLEAMKILAKSNLDAAVVSAMGGDVSPLCRFTVSEDRDQRVLAIEKLKNAGYPPCPQWKPSSSAAPSNEVSDVAGSLDDIYPNSPRGRAVLNALWQRYGSLDKFADEVQKKQQAPFLSADHLLNPCLAHILSVVVSLLGNDDQEISGPALNFLRDWTNDTERDVVLPMLLQMASNANGAARAFHLLAEWSVGPTTQLLNAVQNALLSYSPANQAETAALRLASQWDVVPPATLDPILMAHNLEDGSRESYQSRILAKHWPVGQSLPGKIAKQMVDRTINARWSDSQFVPILLRFRRDPEILSALREVVAENEIKVTHDSAPQTAGAQSFLRGRQQFLEKHAPSIGKMFEGVDKAVMPKEWVGRQIPDEEREKIRKRASLAAGFLALSEIREIPEETLWAFSMRISLETDIPRFAKVKSQGNHLEEVFGDHLLSVAGSEKEAWNGVLAWFEGRVLSANQVVVFTRQVASETIPEKVLAAWSVRPEVVAHIQDIVSHPEQHGPRGNESAPFDLRGAVILAGYAASSIPDLADLVWSNRRRFNDLMTWAKSVQSLALSPRSQMNIRPCFMVEAISMCLIRQRVLSTIS